MTPLLYELNISRNIHYAIFNVVTWQLDDGIPFKVSFIDKYDVLDIQHDLLTKYDYTGLYIKYFHHFLNLIIITTSNDHDTLDIFVLVRVATSLRQYKFSIYMVNIYRRYGHNTFETLLYYTVINRAILSYIGYIWFLYKYITIINEVHIINIQVIRSQYILNIIVLYGQ